MAYMIYSIPTLWLLSYHLVHYAPAVLIFYLCLNILSSFLSQRFCICSSLDLESSAPRFSNAWLSILITQDSVQIFTPQRSLTLRSKVVCLRSSHSLSLNFNHFLSCLIFFIAFSITWNHLIFTCLLPVPLLTPSRMWFYDGRACLSYFLLYCHSLEWRLPCGGSY